MDGNPTRAKSTRRREGRIWQCFRSTIAPQRDAIHAASNDRSAIIEGETCIRQRGCYHVVVVNVEYQASFQIFRKPAL